MDDWLPCAGKHSSHVQMNVMLAGGVDGRRRERAAARVTRRASPGAADPVRPERGQAEEPPDLELERGQARA